MAKRRGKRKIEFFDYECSITGENYRLSREVKNTDDLVSINAYYELNPEEDDRPADIKKKLGIEIEES